MPEGIFEPIPISYRGLFADQHLVDAQQYGRSLVGVSKIANSIVHEMLFDRVTHDPRKYQVRFCVGPSKENGLLQEIFAVWMSGLPLITPVVQKVGTIFVEQMMKAMIAKALNKPSDTAKALEVIAKQAEVLDKQADAIGRQADHMASFALSVQDGHMLDKDRMFSLVDKLVAEHRQPLRQLPEPVGKSVRTMLIGKKDPIVIGEAEAEVMRAAPSSGLELGDEVTYDVEVVGVFKTNGLCRLRVVGDDQVILGKITDPAVEQDHNIYTSALDAGGVLKVVAKPTYKNGKLHKLFVSSAISPEDPIPDKEPVPVTG
jgi:hypothetical protein